MTKRDLEEAEFQIAVDASRAYALANENDRRASASSSGEQRRIPPEGISGAWAPLPREQSKQPSVTTLKSFFPMLMNILQRLTLQSSSEKLDDWQQHKDLHLSTLCLLPLQRKLCLDVQGKKLGTIGRLMKLLNLAKSVLAMMLIVLTWQLVQSKTCMTRKSPSDREQQRNVSKGTFLNSEANTGESSTSLEKGAEATSEPMRMSEHEKIGSPSQHILEKQLANATEAKFRQFCLMKGLTPFGSREALIKKFQTL